MSDIDTKEEDVQEVEKLKADDNMGLSKAETNNLEKGKSLLMREVKLLFLLIHRPP